MGEKVFAQVNTGNCERDLADEGAIMKKTRSKNSVKSIRRQREHSDDEKIQLNERARTRYDPD